MKVKGPNFAKDHCYTYIDLCYPVSLLPWYPLDSKKQLYWMEFWLIGQVMVLTMN